MKSKNNLIFFCLEYNQDSILLSHTYYWVNELATHFSSTTVVCVRANISLKSPEINVIEIGGGSLRKRITALYELIKVTISVIKKHKQTSIFHHMWTQPLALVGWVFKIAKIPQILWYSHSAKNMTLRIGIKFCDFIVTPNLDCFPILNPSKVIEVGHGIQTRRFQHFSTKSKRRNDIVVLGRISQIKHIHELVAAVSKLRLTSGDNLEIDLIGPILDENYCEYLKDLSSKSGVVLRFKPPVSAREVPQILSKYNYSFNGNPKTLDKSAVEAALAGCLLISEVKPVLYLTGMQEVWKTLEGRIPKLEEQITIMSQLTENQKVKMRAILFQRASLNNDLKVTMQRIAKLFQELQK